MRVGGTRWMLWVVQRARLCSLGILARRCWLSFSREETLIFKMSKSICILVEFID